MKVKILSVYRE